MKGYKWDWDYNRRGSDWKGQCSSGKEQSPIDIDRKKEMHKGFLQANPIALNYTQKYGLTASRKPRTDKKNKNSAIEVEGFYPVSEFGVLDMNKSKKQIESTWKPVKMVIRQPSEHTIFGMHSDVEI